MAILLFLIYVAALCFYFPFRKRATRALDAEIGELSIEQQQKFRRCILPLSLHFTFVTDLPALNAAVERARLKIGGYHLGLLAVPGAVLMILTLFAALRGWE